MFDTLKGLAGGGKARQQPELEALIQAAREERNALSTMLTQLTTRGARMMETAKALEQVETRATAAAAALDGLARKVAALERRATALDEVEQRIQTLLDAAARAQQQADTVEELSSQAAAAQASLEAAKREHAVLEAFRGELRDTHAELKDARQSVEQAVALRGELDQVRGLAGQLSQEYARIRDTSREAREESASATEAVREVDRKLGRLSHLQELTRTTEEKVTALNALAEYVGQKTRALESQKHVVERAVVEANRLNEIVWNMDVQLTKANDGMKEAARGEEALARIDQLAQNTEARLESAARLRDEFVRETAQMQREGAAVLDAVRTSLDRLAAEKREIETFEARLQTLHGAVGDAEQRMEALATREQQLGFLPPRIEEFSRQFAALASQAEDLGRKQADLDALHTEIGQVHDLASRTAAQYDALRQSRQDLEALRKEILDFHQSYARAAELRDKLSSDRAALEAFGERLTTLRARTPEIEASMASLLQRLAQVEEGMPHAVRLGEMTTDLERQIARIGERTEFIGIVEGRLNALQALAADVDQKIAVQLDRRADLETLRAQCDGVIAQMLDAQQKIEAVAALQGKILPMDIKISILQGRLKKTAERVKAVHRRCRRASRSSRTSSPTCGSTWRP